MRLFFNRILLSVTIFVFFFTGAVLAGGGQTANQLPAGFAALVPQGAKVTAPVFSKTPIVTTVGFGATKHVKTDRIDDWMTYSFGLRCFSDDIWKSLEQSYRQILEKEIESARKRAEAGVSHYNGKDAYGKEVYPPEVRDYPWGKAVIQRTDIHEIVLISGKVLPIITIYDCKYFGVVNHNVLGISVSGYELSLEDANQWAAQCVAKAERTNLDNIGN